MPQLCLPFGKHNFTLAQAKISPPTAISFALSEFHSFNFYVQDSFVFSPRKNRPKYGRFFVVWIYCFLLKNALLMLVVFTEKCFVDIIVFC
jgi:putative flippase GtrA